MLFAVGIETQVFDHVVSPASVVEEVEKDLVHQVNEAGDAVLVVAVEDRERQREVVVPVEDADLGPGGVDPPVLGELARELLRAGETKAVVSYLSLCRSFWKSGEGRLERWIEDIKQGKNPVLERTEN